MRFPGVSESVDASRRLFVGWEETLDADLLERDIQRRAEGRHGREEFPHEGALSELNRNVRPWKGCEHVQRAPPPRHAWIGEDLFQKIGSPSVWDSSQRLPVNTLDQRLCHG